MKGIPRVISRQRRKKCSAKHRRGTGSRPEELCLLLKTILPANSRNCSAHYGIFVSTTKSDNAVGLGWDAKPQPASNLFNA
jgi:hypothetical protein